LGLLFQGKLTLALKNGRNHRRSQNDRFCRFHHATLKLAIFDILIKIGRSDSFSARKFNCRKGHFYCR